MIGQVNNLYSHKCENCGGFITEDLSDKKDKEWDDIYEEIAEQLLHNKDVKINAKLHLKTAKTLIDAVNKAVIEEDLGKQNPTLIATLKSNIYPFSAAKSFQQMVYYRNEMHDKATGKILSKESFIKRIADTGEIFNKTHLAVEYENAYYSTIMADKWERFSEDEYLQYSTVGDKNVRPSHAVLDKYTAPKSDSFWKNNYPPNGWNCRCTVIPGKANHQNRLTQQQAGRQLKSENKNSPFWNNVGENKLIFHDKHPYMINSKGKISNLSWEQYGLPNLEKIRSEELPEYTPTTKEEYINWWKKQPKIEKDNFILKDKLGNEILFDSGENMTKPSKKFFKHHILEKDKHERFEFATEIPNILNQPDEIWNNKLDQNSTIYLKFYKTGTLKLVVIDGKAKTLYKLFEEDGKLNESRKGILLHR